MEGRRPRWIAPSITDDGMHDGTIIMNSDYYGGMPLHAIAAQLDGGIDMLLRVILARVQEYHEHWSSVRGHSGPPPPVFTMGSRPMTSHDIDVLNGRFISGRR